jgi:hypothetical protein
MAAASTPNGLEPRGRTLVVLAVVGLLAFKCGPEPRHLLVENQTSKDLWFTRWFGDGYPLDGWEPLPASETARYGPLQECLDEGEIVIAESRDLPIDTDERALAGASSVIDRRALVDEPWCPGQTWTWSGPGDYD